MNGRRDPGLQPERTRLAWARTLLAYAANLLLIVRVCAISEQPGVWAVLSASLLPIALVALSTQRRNAALLGRPESLHAMHSLGPLLIAFASLGLCVTALLAG